MERKYELGSLLTPTNESIIYSYDSAIAFEKLGAQDWIDSVRVENNGNLDIEATAQGLEISVDYEMPLVNGEKLAAHASIEGLGEDLGLKPIAVHINPNWRTDEHDVSFGHELGHLFLEIVAGIVQGQGRNNTIERFCEYFGRQMALPTTRLNDIKDVKADDILVLAEHFNTHHSILIYQLMLAGKMPRRIFLDTSIEDVPNPFYAGRVRRHCVCLNCEIGRPHIGMSNPGMGDIPTYDLTSLKLSGSTSGYCSEAPKDMNEFIAVNKMYGCWTDENERLLPEELERGREMDLILAAARRGEI